MKTMLLCSLNKNIMFIERSLCNLEREPAGLEKSGFLKVRVITYLENSLA